MKCLDEHDLHRLLDDELSPTLKMLVTLHVKTCPACAARLHELQMIGEALRAAPMPAPPAGAMRRWRENVMVVRDHSVRRLAGWMTAAASIVLVVSLYAASSNHVQATPMLSEWEAAVIGIDVDSASSDQTIAQWMATDLSRRANGSANP
jgi:anti-sigma factor RsiW